MISSTQTNHPLVDAANATKAQEPLSLACAHLKSAGLRITQPRIAILTALIKSGQPTSIEQIHATLPAGSCDLVTVYRCMGAFEEIGLVRRSFYHNGTSLYTVSLGESNSYHVVCKNTNRLEALDEGTINELRRCVQQVESILRSRGYDDVSHVVEFFGVAPAPSRANQDASAIVTSAS
ncbi:MAG: transcriptional repressor [Verrucomicrobia bacterium]|nr:transcriptional repressor [Verrucomicrobiota bacterium]